MDSHRCQAYRDASGQPVSRQQQPSQVRQFLQLGRDISIQLIPPEIQFYEVVKATQFTRYGSAEKGFFNSHNRSKLISPPIFWGMGPLN